MAQKRKTRTTESLRSDLVGVLVEPSTKVQLNYLAKAYDQSASKYVYLLITDAIKRHKNLIAQKMQEEADKLAKLTKGN